MPEVGRVTLVAAVVVSVSVCAPALVRVADATPRLVMELFPILRFPVMATDPLARKSPTLAVVQLRVPVPFVERTWPFNPALVGRVKARFAPATPD